MSLPEPLSEVVARGVRRDSLVALRDALAVSIEAAEPREVASLAKQLRDVLAELDSLKVPEVSTSDDLKDRRAKRLGPKVPDVAAVGEQRGARSGGARGKRGADS